MELKHSNQSHTANQLWGIACNVPTSPYSSTFNLKNSFYVAAVWRALSRVTTTHRHSDAGPLLSWKRDMDRMPAYPRGQAHAGRSTQEQLTGQGLRPFPICIPILVVGSLKHCKGIQGLPLASQELLLNPEGKGTISAISCLRLQVRFCGWP